MEKEPVDKKKYFKMALALTGIVADERTCDMVISVYERLEKLGGEFSVHDAVAIQCENERKYTPPPPDKNP